MEKRQYQSPAIEVLQVKFQGLMKSASFDTEEGTISSGELDAKHNTQFYHDPTERPSASLPHYNIWED